MFVNKPLSGFALPSLMIAAALVNNGLFGQSSLFASIAMVLVASLFIIRSVVRHYSVKKDGYAIHINWLPSFLWLSLCLYYYCRTMVDGALSMGLVHSYWICLGLLLCVLTVEFAVRPGSFRIIARMIVAAALLESVVSLLQYSGLLSSMSPLFRVTGTWVNPNVTGMFLAMSVPAAILLFWEEKGAWRKIAIASLVMDLPALAFLGTRTAVVGITMIVLQAAIGRSGGWQWLRRQFHGWKAVSLLLLLAITLVAGGWMTWRYKQESSRGRLLVWKVSLQAIRNKPLFGAGLGMFEHDYNLDQARYLQDNKVPATERDLASFVQVAYNELLSNAVEGGLIGALLFIFFLGSILFPRAVTGGQRDPGSIAARSGVWAFAVMSLINFTINAVPVMLLFILYAAKNSSGQPGHQTTWYTRPNIYKKPTYAGLLCLAAISLLIFEGRQAEALHQAANGERLALQGNYREAALIESRLRGRLTASRWYWMAYGNILYSMKHYAGALDKYRRAASLSSNPDCYYYLGNCCFRLKRLDESEAAYRIAAGIQPGRFRPRLALMRLYAYRKDTLQALSSAREIVDLRPKIPSDKIVNDKNEASQLILKWGNIQ